MGEIRSPYFSFGQYHFGDNSDIHSPSFSYGRDDYHGDIAEIHPVPYSSAGVYLGDHAEIHPPYSSAGDYLGDNAEIHSAKLFQQDISENPYIVEQVVEQHIVQNLHEPARSHSLPGVDDIPEQLANALIGAKKSKSSVSIYKVHNERSRSDVAIYSPQQISIGPIHHGEDYLESMQEQKIRYYQQFWVRVSKGMDKDKDQRGVRNDFWNHIEKKKDEILNCYAEGSHKKFKDDTRYRKEVGTKRMGEKQIFPKMVLLDAVFIFELFLKYSDGVEKYQEDYLMSRPWLRMLIRRDLVLLENQLPFFILKELYELLPEKFRRVYPKFIDLAWFYFKRLFKIGFLPEKDPLHFTDLLRSLLSFSQKKKNVEPINSNYSATKLRQAGVKFQDPQQHDDLLDVKFCQTRGEFSIPQLQINSDTKFLFSNLMALETRHYQGKEYICHYLHLLKTLVAEPKDAKLLMKNKIVIYHNEHAVKNLIHKLAADTKTDPYSCYYDILWSVEKYNEECWPKNLASFRREYSGSIWKVLGMLGAILLLILTLIQAICAIIALR